MLFVITTFSLFYFTYLHNFLYVYEFTTDTGGLSFPRAIYQTMTGLYFLEICLMGLFFIEPGARAQGIVMAVVLVLTVFFHLQLSSSFDPLITYLPIDIQEALINKVESQKEEEGRRLSDEEQFKGQREGPKGTGDLHRSPALDDLAAIPENPSNNTPPAAKQVEFRDIDPTADVQWRPSLKTRIKNVRIPGLTKKKTFDDDDDSPLDELTRKYTRDLTLEERTAIAFQHEALRARPPILWVPEDELGIAQDEIYHTKREGGNEIQMSSEGATLDNKGKISWLGNPPDYFDIQTI
jgi:calcium permeable stress-gated cation channel